MYESGFVVRLLRRLVIETLNEVEQGRKCFRMVGGVLVERTVAEVLPALQKNVESVSLFLSLYSLLMLSSMESLLTYFFS